MSRLVHRPCWINRAFWVYVRHDGRNAPRANAVVKSHEPFLALDAEKNDVDGHRLHVLSSQGTFYVWVNDDDKVLA